MEVFKLLVEKGRNDEILEVLSFLEDFDIVQCSQVSTEWREVIIGTGELRRRMNRMEESLPEREINLRWDKVGHTSHVGFFTKRKEVKFSLFP